MLLDKGVSYSGWLAKYAAEDSNSHSNSSLDGGRVRTYALIDQLREKESTELVCSAFDISTSCFYEYKARKCSVDPERLLLRSELRRLFKESRSSAGSRSLKSMMQELGYQVGRFKMRNLMKEAGLMSKQPGSRVYTQVERPDTPNRLEMQFDIAKPNQVWCGDITYIWAGSRWHYLAAVIDLHMCWAMSEKPDGNLVVKSLDMAYQQRGCPPGVTFHSDQGSQYTSRKFRQRLWC